MVDNSNEIQAVLERFKTYKEKLAPNTNLIISKSGTNEDFNEQKDLFWAYEFTENSITPDNFLAQLKSELGFEVKNKSESGGRIFILPKEHF